MKAIKLLIEELCDAKERATAFEASANAWQASTYKAWAELSDVKNQLDLLVIQRDAAFAELNRVSSQSAHVKP